MNLIDEAKKLFKRKPKTTGKVYIGIDLESPHAGLSFFAEVKPSGASFCVEGFAPILKAEFCGKLLDWDNMPAKFLSGLKTGGSVTIPLDKFKALIK